MKIQESAEMYMEAILVLSQKQDIVRAIDVGNYLSYSKPSVSRAMKSLKEEHYIVIDEHGRIQLTPKGETVAQGIYEKHRILGELFESIGVPEEIAHEDACKIEHVISDVTFEKLKQFFNKNK
ncbi:MAG: metal-dependent transcriptional regulator [Anaerorhabdus sp.]